MKKRLLWSGSIGLTVGIIAFLLSGPPSLDTGVSERVDLGRLDAGSAVDPPTTVPARGSASFAVVAHLPDKAGPFEVQATILYKDGRTRQFTLSADVVRPVPSDVELGDVRIGSPLARDVPLGVVVGDVSTRLDPTGDPRLDATVLGDEATGRVLHLGFDPSGAEGEFDQTITVLTPQSTRKQWPVRVTGRLLPTFEARPNKLLFGVVGEDSPTREVRVKANYGDSFRVASVASEGGNGCISAGEARACEDGYVVPVTINGAESSGAVAGRVRVVLELAGGESRAVEIGVYALKQR